MAKHKQGYILVYVIIAFTLLVILGTGVVSLAVNSNRQTQNQIYKQQAYYTAESGLKLFLAKMTDNSNETNTFLTNVASTITTVNDQVSATPFSNNSHLGGLKVDLKCVESDNGSCQKIEVTSTAVYRGLAESVTAYLTNIGRRDRMDVPVLVTDTGLSNRDYDHIRNSDGTIYQTTYYQYNYLTVVDELNKMIVNNRLFDKYSLNPNDYGRCLMLNYNSQSCTIDIADRARNASYTYITQNDLMIMELDLQRNTQIHDQFFYGGLDELDKFIYLPNEPTITFNGVFENDTFYVSADTAYMTIIYFGSELIMDPPLNHPDVYVNIFAPFAQVEIKNNVYIHGKIIAHSLVFDGTSSRSQVIATDASESFNQVLQYIDFETNADGGNSSTRWEVTYE